MCSRKYPNPPQRGLLEITGEGEGVQKAKLLKESVNNKLNFQRHREGEGGQTKNPPWEGYGFFPLEQYNVKYVNGDSPRQVIAFLSNLRLLPPFVMIHHFTGRCVDLLKEHLSWLFADCSTA